LAAEQRRFPSACIANRPKAAVQISKGEPLLLTLAAYGTFRHGPTVMRTYSVEKTAGTSLRRKLRWRRV